VSPKPPHRVSAGEPHPLGATVGEGGVNFSLFSRSATSVELLLFDRYEAQPVQTIRLDPHEHRTFTYWHAFVHGIGEGQLYAYRVDGPHAPAEGHRFNPRKVLLDPYARGIVYADDLRTHNDASHPDDNVLTAMKSLVVDPHTFDWEGVTPPKIDPAMRIIYEVHVAGLTRDPSSGVAHPGTFDALIEKIPYLQELGVTTIELLPVFQFDENDNRFFDPRTGDRLTNYWGYNPVGFFAPHRGFYTEGWGRMRYLTGFRDMVKALHRAGMEVFLDVVFNHTAEGDADGPTLSFRGLENSVYYLLDDDDRSHYSDYSGTGNTVSCNHPMVRKLILDCLRYWVDVMRVDGFRFDLAAVLSRDERGRPMADPPLPWEIEMDPVLSRTRLVAEAWDAAGLYQVGDFPGERWFEWNGRFRDDIRRFLRGDHGLVGSVATRMLGSPDLYRARGRLALQSINFVTCHDGFTLYDLCAYENKHNDANGEAGRDGTPENYSCNYGVEGPSGDPALERLRRQQMKNAIALLLLSQGTPMLLGGDEIGRTQRGNNNAYCQDNDVSWFDWNRMSQFEDVHRFTRLMIRFRQRHPSLRRRRFLLGADSGRPVEGETRVRWHGVEVDRPDWSDGSRTLAFTLTRSDDDWAIHVMINMHVGSLVFGLPEPASGTRWWRVIDTARPPPHDFADEGRQWPAAGPNVVVQARSIVVMVEE
jgi:isoamylase